jgi:hypothetical protein
MEYLTLGANRLLAPGPFEHLSLPGFDEPTSLDLFVAEVVEIWRLRSESTGNHVAASRRVRHGYVSWLGDSAELEAEVGIEPAYTELQSAA